MLSKLVIEPAKTERTAPIVFLPQRNGILEIHVDYSKLSEGIRRDSYPPLCVNKLIVSLGDAKVFSTLNAKSGYWQVKVDEEYSDKTAILSHHGLYRYVKMQFYLKYAPGTLQLVRDMILLPVKWQNALAYLADIVVSYRSPNKHIDQV